jgi:acetyl-CoA carboxylase biotin carboxyl carrier protein
MSIDIKNNIKSLYEIMKEEKIQELEVNSKDCSVRIKRKDNSKVMLQKKHDVTTPQVFFDIAEKKETSILSERIKSPITGIFYRSPSPSAPFFINEGDVVEVGKTICIIEAMKVMNEVKATFKAKIIKVLIETGKSVNSGGDLFEVERYNS